MGEVRYKAWGEERYTAGTTPTTYRYTGQRAESGIGLYFYNARWYDPALGRFVQADTTIPSDSDQAALVPLLVGVYTTDSTAVVGEENREVLRSAFWPQREQQPRQNTKHHVGPANPQQLNRYAYCLGNPLSGIDLTGHWTFFIGLSGIFGGGIAGWANMGIIIDSHSNIGLMAGGGGGGVAVAAGGVGVTVAGSTADTIYDLEGPNVGFGGSVGEGIGLGADVFWGPERANERPFGVSVTGQFLTAKFVGVPGGEFHGGVTFSKVLASGNIPGLWPGFMAGLGFSSWYVGSPPDADEEK